eukprot:comp20782_c0_seq1/m.42863 comp20782_c0_seq1/g.42863  ORF comp20782_c0_seq1/g.42863 comp20782_c0_seq1/m.42863 type:complete len:346 (+) comp20782_c0_seq1:667-1704(+)
MPHSSRSGSSSSTTTSASATATRPDSPSCCTRCAPQTMSAPSKKGWRPHWRILPTLPTHTATMRTMQSRTQSTSQRHSIAPTATTRRSSRPCSTSPSRCPQQRAWLPKRPSASESSSSKSRQSAISLPSSNCSCSRRSSRQNAKDSRRAAGPPNPNPAAASPQHRPAEQAAAADAAGTLRQALRNPLHWQSSPSWPRRASRTSKWSQQPLACSTMSRDCGPRSPSQSPRPRKASMPSCCRARRLRRDQHRISGMPQEQETLHQVASQAAARARKRARRSSRPRQRSAPPKKPSGPRPKPQSASASAQSKRRAASSISPPRCLRPWCLSQSRMPCAGRLSITLTRT